MEQLSQLKQLSLKYKVPLSKVEVLKLLFDEVGINATQEDIWENMKTSLSDVLNNRLSTRVAGSRVIRMVLTKTPFIDTQNQITLEGNEMLKEMALAYK